MFAQGNFENETKIAPLVDKPLSLVPESVLAAVRSREVRDVLKRAHCLSSTDKYSVHAEDCNASGRGFAHQSLRVVRPEEQ